MMLELETSALMRACADDSSMLTRRGRELERLDK